MSRRHGFAGLLAVCALAITACGGGDQNYPSAIDGDPGTTIPAALTNLDAPKPRDPSTALPKTSAVKDVSTDLNVKPKLGKPSGDPPTELQGFDVTPGSGPAAKTGDTVEVQYVGVLFDGGKEFDTSFVGNKPGNTPFTFKIGAGNVIKGWDEGVIGMKVGMRRILSIPSDLAYGSNGSPPTIGADEPLVFAIDLKKIK